MKRHKRQLKGTREFIKVTSQVSKQRKPFYKGILIMSIHEIIETPAFGNTDFGKVWIVGDHGHPVVIYAHEYQYYKFPIRRIRKTPLKRIRKKSVKIKRTRKNLIKRKRSK
jgi:hypothetical protein